MGEKLILKRDEDRWNGYGEDDTPAICTPKQNQQATAAFLKKAIEEAGYTPRKAVSRDYYDNTSKVFIKELGGKFFIWAYDGFSSAEGDSDEDEVEVKVFCLGCSDYRATPEDDDVTYKSFDDIVSNLPKHLNMYAGTIRTLTKGEAKKTKAA